MKRDHLTTVVFRVSRNLAIAGTLGLVVLLWGLTTHFGFLGSAWPSIGWIEVNGILGPRGVDAAAWPSAGDGIPFRSLVAVEGEEWLGAVEGPAGPLRPLRVGGSVVLVEGLSDDAVPGDAFAVGALHAWPPAALADLERWREIQEMYPDVSSVHLHADAVPTRLVAGVLLLLTLVGAALAFAGMAQWRFVFSPTSYRFDTWGPEVRWEDVAAELESQDIVSPGKGDAVKISRNWLLVTDGLASVELIPTRSLRWVHGEKVSKTVQRPRIPGSAEEMGKAMAMAALKALGGEEGEKATVVVHADSGNDLVPKKSVKVEVASEEAMGLLIQRLYAANPDMVVGHSAEVEKLWAQSDPATFLEAVRKG